MNNPDTSEEPFDFSKYSVKSNINQPLPQKNEVPNQESIPEKPFDFNKYKPKQEPTKLEEFGRHVARTGARVAETITGFPGDVVNFVKFLNEKLPEGPKFLQREPSFVGKIGKKALESIPSSQDLKEVSSYLTSGFTDPKGATEELGDEITSLATSLMIPSKDPTKFKSLLSALGIASATKGARKGAELLGASPTVQSATELGSLFLSSFLSKKFVDKFASEQFEKARSLIPQGSMVQTNKLNASLNVLEQDLSRGISTPTKTEVKKAVQELNAKAAGGSMEADELVESYHNINERYNSKKLFDELNSTERKTLKFRFDKLKDEVGSEIKDYGNQNPEFYKQWLRANEAFATIAKSKGVSQFLQSKLGSIPKHLAGTVAMELFLGHPTAAAATVGVAGAVKTGELLYRIAKSPTLRKHYLNVIKDAGKENLPAAIKSIESLNKELEKK